jgi:hypothetical protein
MPALVHQSRSPWNSESEPSVGGFGLVMSLSETRFVMPSGLTDLDGGVTAERWGSAISAEG